MGFDETAPPGTAARSGYLQVGVEAVDGERGALLEDGAAERRGEGDAQPHQEQLQGQGTFRSGSRLSTESEARCSKMAQQSGVAKVTHSPTRNSCKVGVEAVDGERGALLEDGAAERRGEGDAQPHQEQLQGQGTFRSGSRLSTESEARCSKMAQQSGVAKVTHSPTRNSCKVGVEAVDGERGALLEDGAAERRGEGDAQPHQEQLEGQGTFRSGSRLSTESEARCSKMAQQSGVAKVGVEAVDGERGALLEDGAAERRGEGDAQPHQEQLQGQGTFRSGSRLSTESEARCSKMAQQSGVAKVTHSPTRNSWKVRVPSGRGRGCRRRARRAARRWRSRAAWRR
ncbi:unnamed protein product [Euphydryas editha]|uniref:Uncharacterized protein n=1 Tax=Euphydryas editha TaxID=104508 RepID=A0AAU9UDA1_EUPED|nr:unnamed protein product [Euphydryas editha]